MVQDIFPSEFHNEFRPQAMPGPDSPVICFDGRKILAADKGGSLSLPGAGELGIESAGEQVPPEVIYGFAVDETEYFIYVGEALPCAAGFEYLDIRNVRKWADNVSGMVMFTGYHLSQWYKDSRYCGRCGGRNIFHESERAMRCPACDRNIYPRIMPAVIIGVINGDGLLLTKYREGFNNYALVAGFTEIGETLEETVAREVMEEAGLKVRNIRYYKSQPWGLANDILMGFFCDVDGDDEIRMDANELKLAEWKSPEEIILHPDSFSLTNEMMTVFKNGELPCQNPSD